VAGSTTADGGASGQAGNAGGLYAHEPVPTGMWR